MAPHPMALSVASSCASSPTGSGTSPSPSDVPEPCSEVNGLSGMSDFSSLFSSKASSVSSQQSTPPKTPAPAQAAEKVNKPRSLAQTRARRLSMAMLQREAEVLRAQNVKLQAKIVSLGRRNWKLENEITQLQAELLTSADQVAQTAALEAQLGHAQQYVRALQAQVQALGGYVLCEGREEAGEDDDDGDDGELPVGFPRAAAHPEEYTLSAIKQRRALRRKQRRKLY